MTAMLGIFLAGAIAGGGAVTVLFLWLDCKYGPGWDGGDDAELARKRAEWEEYLKDENGEPVE